MSIPIGVVIGAAVFTGCGLVAALRQQAWEFPVIHAFNAVAGRSALLDRGIHALTSRDLLQGAVFVALIWYLWFDTADVGVRARLLTGTLAATLGRDAEPSCCRSSCQHTCGRCTRRRSAS